jgi:hypothetical protein
MTRSRSSYRAYLLRLWRTAEAHLRASLEDPHTGEQRAFATLEQLVAFLDNATGGGPGKEPAPGMDNDGSRHDDQTVDLPR